MSRSAVNNHFAKVPQANIQRSVFDRSHNYKTTFDSGKLIPIYVDEVLPGDSLSVDMTAFARLATPISPFMDNLKIDFHFFFVPNRLVWDNWQRFCGERLTPTDETDFLVPQCAFSSTENGVIGSIYDYMGIPVSRVGPNGIIFNALPFRAYNLIWNEWYRDQNLQNPVPVPVNDLTNFYNDFKLLPRAKRHDYFTSCLPWPQKGPSVQLPLGTTAPVWGELYGDGLGSLSGKTQAINFAAVTLSNTSMTSFREPTGSAGSNVLRDQPGQHADWFGLISKESGVSTSGIYADLSEATAATINQLRQAFQIQRMFERDARGGSRYIEILRSHFGVISPDARLQRPEYLGGGSQMVNVTPIAQTSATDGTTPQGNLAATGTSTGRAGFSKSFVEHGFVIGLASVRSFPSYQQGLERFWSRRTRFDYYWPSLANLGEQAVLNKEIYFSDEDSSQSINNAVFGYQERYAEYRYKPSLITGKMRSGVAGSLDIWHLAQNFSALPQLGSTFIQDTPPIDRVVAVSSEPEFLFDAYFKVKSARPMPVYSVPGLIDHF